MFVLHDGVDISSGSSSAICIRTRFCPRSLNCICWNPSQITGRVKLTRKIPPINSKGTNIIDLEVKLMRSATCKQQQKLNFSVRKWQCTKQPFIKVVRMAHNITACLPCIKVAASILVRGALIVSYCVVMNTFEPRWEVAIGWTSINFSIGPKEVPVIWVCWQRLRPRTPGSNPPKQAQKWYILTFKLCTTN